MTREEQIKNWPKDSKGRMLCTPNLAMPIWARRVAWKHLKWSHVETEATNDKTLYCPHCGCTLKSDNNE